MVKEVVDKLLKTVLFYLDRSVYISRTETCLRMESSLTKEEEKRDPNVCGVTDQTFVLGPFFFF